MRRLWLQIAHTSGATLVSVAASVVTVGITARFLGPAGRGLYVAATTWAGMFATLGTLSIGQVLIRDVAGRDPNEWIAEAGGTVLALTAIVAVLGWAVLAVLYVSSAGAIFGGVPALLIGVAFLSLPLLMWLETGRYLLVALDALRVANWAQVASAAAALLAMIVLVGIARTGVLGAIAATVVANAAGALLLLRHLLTRQRRLTPSRRMARTLLRGSAQLHLNAVGNYLFTQASVLVLNYYRPEAETAYYQLAAQLFGLGLTVSSAVSVVSFGLVAREGPNGAWPEQKRLIVQALLIVAVIAVAGYLLAPLGVRLVAGDRFLPTVPLFRLILPALFGATFSTVMASQWVGRGLFLQAALLTLAVGTVSLALDLVFVPRYGVRGAVVSTLVTYAISIAANGIMALWVNRESTRAGAAP